MIASHTDKAYAYGEVTIESERRVERKQHNSILSGGGKFMVDRLADGINPLYVSSVRVYSYDPGTGDRLVTRNGPDELEVDIPVVPSQNSDPSIDFIGTVDVDQGDFTWVAMDLGLSDNVSAMSRVLLDEPFEKPAHDRLKITWKVAIDITNI